jgi:RecJ-like exonuclease
MTVYELIQELVNFDPNANVMVTSNGDEDTTCPECKHEFTVSYDNSLDIYDVRTDKYHRSQVEIRIG